MAGPDARDRLSLPEPGSTFLAPLERDFRATRIAFTRDLGRYPVEHAVARVCDAARPVLTGLGCDVADDTPDLEGVDELFQTLRAHGYALGHRRDLERHRELLKDTVVWNIERGLALTPADLARADAIKASLDSRVASFFRRYEFLVLPVVQVAPFAVDTPWVREIEGVPMRTYIDWMATCYAISCTGLPAISVPCGFTEDGLPIGLQIVGRHGRDFEVLQLAHAFEQATRFALRRPALAVL